MALGESANETVPVLLNAPYQIVGPPDVQGAVPRAGKNVDVECHCMRPWIPAYAGMSGRNSEHASERNLVVHVVALAAGAGHGWLALARGCRTGRTEIAAVGARATTRAVKHRQRRIESLQNHFGRITVLPVFVLPFARLQRALEINLRALLEILLGDLG